MKQWMKAEKELDIYFYVAGWILAAVLVACAVLANVWHISLFKAAAPCLFHAATGYYCPGCGGTRAVYALFSGHPLRSFRYHPVVLYVALVGGYFMISQTIERLSVHRLAVAMHFRVAYLWGTLFLIVGNVLVKNALLFLLGVDLLAV
jgi:hypothetical protein